MKDKIFQTFDTPQRQENPSCLLEKLRQELKVKKLDGYIIPRTDFFQGEYVAPSDERLKFFTGFTGSAGFCCVLQEKASIFVDGRYRVQVKQEVSKDYEIIHWPEVTLWDWLNKNLLNGTVGYDPNLHTIKEIDELGAKITSTSIQLTQTENLIDLIWESRPDSPLGQVTEHRLNFSGETSESKCAKISHKLRESEQKFCVLTDPESISWLLNLRGQDVPRTPVVQACAIISDDARVDLFIQLEKTYGLSKKNLRHVFEFPFSEFKNHLRTLKGKTRIDYQKTPMAVKESIDEYVFGDDPCLLPKAKKNNVEIQGTKKAHVRDATAVTEFLFWVSKQKPGTFTEIDAVTQLERLRRNLPNFRDISFDTISGSGPNGALPHYRVTHKTNRVVKNGDILLVDSGAQFLDGTTDITRSISVGSPTNEQKKFYTLVLKGMIAISKVRFPRGLAGRDIDSLARVPLWEIGHDYDHGTGHGVGVYLSVHEGPQRISRASNIVLEEGMILSNEPGFYKEGSFGIRIENLLIVKKAKKLKAFSNRDMLEFETISFAPLDRKLIIKDILTKAEIDWINQYNKSIQSKVVVSKECEPWLKKETRPL
ncbi:MAG: aminopeptidase P family protein [Rhodobacteraceae bacterium]|nr:aminopeptidase P family protein [Paracoccaceae bacterium]